MDEQARGIFLGGPLISFDVTLSVPSVSSTSYPGILETPHLLPVSDQETMCRVFVCSCLVVGLCLFSKALGINVLGIKPRASVFKTYTLRVIFLWHSVTILRSFPQIICKQLFCFKWKLLSYWPSDVGQVFSLSFQFWKILFLSFSKIGTEVTKFWY